MTGADIPRLTVVVPVLNEAELLAEFLAHLRERAPSAQIIIVDGGSGDGTADRARDLAGPLRLEVLTSSRGRALQMNAGAAAARGEILWFLHADSRVPEDAERCIAGLLSDPAFAGGCFRLRIPRPEPVYRVSDTLGNLAVDLFRIALGDHGIFCRKEAFRKVGGYPDTPLMEDAELYRRLQRVGRVRQLAPAVETSPRRYERRGPARLTLTYAVILSLYLLRVPPEILARLHRRLA